ncbi:hypothetical protein ACERIT_12785 [Halopenitus sp. H-Gu1]|uniref:hypothetical protein n=1 Tax=Halopenitus sp. H-Gu1 TaxID=3242697 RepID=UPI00359DBA3B
MSKPSPNADRTNWSIVYENAEPIHIRDPVAEALTVLEPGAPFVITYADVLKVAGHSCPTASGAYRIAQLGLDALYPDGHPVRGDIEVIAGGPKTDPTYGVTSRIISYVTGAAEDDGFGGLAGSYGDRRDLLAFDGFDPASSDPTFRFRRTDTDETVEVAYHVSDIPDGGSAMGYLQRILDGSASDDQRDAFGEAWHGRIRIILTDDSLFTVETVPTE